MQILDEGSNLRPLSVMKDSKEGIHDLKYSPNNRYLAAATFDCWIDVYKYARFGAVSAPFRCLCPCLGFIVRGCLQMPALPPSLSLSWHHLP